MNTRALALVLSGVCSCGAAIPTVCSHDPPAEPRRVVFLYGQSNTYGHISGGIIHSTQTLLNEMFSDNAVEVSVDVTSGMLKSDTSWDPVPLVETDQEKPRAGLADEYAVETGHSLLTITVARGGTTYAQLRANTDVETSLTNALTAIANNAPDSEVVGMVLFLGESDEGVGTPDATFEADLEQLQSDFETMVHNALGPVGTIPLYVVQPDSWGGWGHTTPVILQAYYDAADNNPGKIILVGGTYQFPHVDSYHRTAFGQCMSGAQAGHALAVGTSWQPMRINATPTLSGSTITATFYVRHCPLLTASNFVTASNGYKNLYGLSATTRGFEYTCGDTPPSISGVVLSCSGTTGTATITLSGAPSASCQTDDTLSYAYTATGAWGRGTVCDSDPAQLSTCSATEHAFLFNCLMPFTSPVN